MSKREQDLALQLHEDRFAEYLQKLVEIGIIATVAPIANASGDDVPIANASDVPHIPTANASDIGDVETPALAAQLLLVKRILEILAI